MNIINIDSTNAKILSNADSHNQNYSSFSFRTQNDISLANSYGSIPKQTIIANSHYKYSNSPIFKDKNQIQLTNTDYMLPEIAETFIDKKISNKESTRFVSSSFLSSFFKFSSGKTINIKDTKVKKINNKLTTSSSSKLEKPLLDKHQNNSIDISKIVKHTKFSLEEDLMLKKIVFVFGPKNWKFIASLIPGRTSKQCRDRYANYLAPGFIRKDWTKEEDDILRSQYKLYGPKWALISQFLPYRSSNDVKNRFNNVISKKMNDNKSPKAKNLSSKFCPSETKNNKLDNDKCDKFFSGDEDEFSPSQFYSYDDIFPINDIDYFL